MRVGETFTLKSPYSPHKNHSVTLVARDELDDYWECECGESWITAFDPDGELGSSEE